EIEQFSRRVVVRDLKAETDHIQEDASTLKIKIDDLNDNRPKFTKPFYKFLVNEIAKRVIYVLHKRKHYGNLVFLNGNTGEIVVASKLDREATEWINFTVKAIDSGSPARAAGVEVVVQIFDENGNSSVFAREPTALMIPEDIPPGSQITTIKATHEDSGEYGKITFILDTVSALGKFSIERDTGILKVAEKLNREEKGQYLIIIQAWGNYQYGFNSGESRNAFKHLNENVIIDIADGIQQDLFDLNQINEWAVQVRTTRSLKRRHGSYTLIIQAQDLGKPSLLVEAPLHICVMDYIDHVPVFVSPSHNSTLRVPENATVGSPLLQIVTTDEDVGPNGAVRYRHKADPAGHWRAFNLHPTSGILELRWPINRKKQKIFDLTTRGSLGIPTSLSSDLDLMVYVTDINEYQPQFTGEDSALIWRVEAFDLDGSSPNNCIVYRIQQSAFDKFIIDSETGVISTVYGANLDPDLTKPRKMVYPLKVLALDGGQGENQLAAAVTVEISIQDVNNKNPEILELDEFRVPENTPVGTVIAKITARDLDESANLTYFIDKEHCQAIDERGIRVKNEPIKCFSYFTLDPSAGSLSGARNIDREEIEQFSLRVVVRDLNAETDHIQEDASTLKIKIDDLNDNSPKFTEPFYKFLVNENSKNGVLIGTIKANDADANKSVTYVLDKRQHYGNLVFLDGNTGEIVVGSKLDREATEWINFTVKAIDSGSPARAAGVEVVVQIFDENGNSSVFAREPTALMIPEDIPPADVLRLVDQNTEKLDDLFKGKHSYCISRMSPG
ncbi:hypothetical protein HUJ04_003323, partial [Dendroctonus ponderosae]